MCHTSTPLIECITIVSRVPVPVVQLLDGEAVSDEVRQSYGLPTGEEEGEETAERTAAAEASRNTAEIGDSAALALEDVNELDGTQPTKPQRVDGVAAEFVG